MNVKEIYEADFNLEPEKECREEAAPVAEETLTVSCLLADVRRAEIRGGSRRANEWIRELHLDPDIMTRYEAVLVAPGIERVIKEMVAYRNADYNTTCSIFGSKQAHAIDADTWAEDSEIEERGGEQFRRWLGYMSGHIRRLLAEFDPVTKAAICKVASMYSKDMLRDDGGSSFSLNVLPEESLLMNIKYFGQIDWAGEKLFVHKKDLMVSGMTMVFEDGVEVNDICRSLGEPLDGSYEVLQYEGSWYATEKIANLVVVPEATNHAVVTMHWSTQKEFQNVLDALTAPDADAHILANAVDGDRLVVGDKNYKISLPAGKSRMSKELDYRKVKFVEVLTGSLIDPNGESKQSMLICFELGDQLAKPEPKTFKLVTAAMRRQGIKQQGGLFDEGI